MTNLFFLIAALPFPDSTTAKSEPRFRLANKQVSQVEASVLACLNGTPAAIWLVC